MQLHYLIAVFCYYFLSQVVIHLILPICTMIGSSLYFVVMLFPRNFLFNGSKGHCSGCKQPSGECTAILNRVVYLYKAQLPVQ